MSHPQPDRTMVCRCTHADHEHRRTGAASWACTACTCIEFARPSADFVYGAQMLGQVQMWPWDHSTCVHRGEVVCSVCGPLTPDQYVHGPSRAGDVRPQCVHWRSPEPTPDELATMNCPDWCDPASHDRDKDGNVERDHHSSDGGSVSLVREDIAGIPGEVRLVVYVDEYRGIRPAEARQLAAELLDAADALEASA